MTKFSIGDIVSRAWDLAVKHWPIFLLLSIIESILGNGMISMDTDALQAVAASGDPDAIMTAYAESISFNPIVGTLCVLLSIYVGFLTYKLYVNAYVWGKPYDNFTEVLKVDFNQLAIFFCVELVYGIVVGLACLFCLLPGIWLGIRLWYAPLLAATQGTSFSESFRRSWELTKGNFWNLLLMGITMIGIGILGFCACCVGYLFAAIVIQFMMVVSFFVLKGNDEFTEINEEPTSQYVKE